MAPVFRFRSIRATAAPDPSRRENAKPRRHSGARPLRREPGIHNRRSWLWIPGLRQGAHPGMTVLVIIPRHAYGTGDVVVAGGEFEAGAGGLLADVAAVELLPWRLVFRIGESAHCFEFGE